MRSPNQERPENREMLGFIAVLVAVSIAVVIVPRMRAEGLLTNRDAMLDGQDGNQSIKDTSAAASDAESEAMAAEASGKVTLNRILQQQPSVTSLTVVDSDEEDCLSLSRSGSLLSAVCGDEIVVLDLVNPDNPAIVGAIEVGGQRGVIESDSQYAYAFGSGELTVVDITNPVSPTIVSNSSFGGSGTRSSTLEGDLFYLGEAANPSIAGGIRVFDVSSPVSPTLVTMYRVGGQDVSSLAIYSGTLFAGLSEGVGFGEVRSFAAYTGTATSTRPHGQMLAVGAVGGMGEDNGTVVFQSYHPHKEIARLTTLSVDDEGYELSASGVYTYSTTNDAVAATDSAGTRVYRASVIPSLGEVVVDGARAFGIESHRIRREGEMHSELLHLLRAIDISTPTHTGLADVAIEGDHIHEMIFYNDHVYIAAGTGGIVTVRVD